MIIIIMKLTKQSKKNSPRDASADTREPAQSRQQGTEQQAP